MIIQLVQGSKRYNTGIRDFVTLCGIADPNTPMNFFQMKMHKVITLQRSNDMLVRI